MTHTHKMADVPNCINPADRLTKVRRSKPLSFGKRTKPPLNENDSTTIPLGPENLKPKVINSKTN